MKFLSSLLLLAALVLSQTACTTLVNRRDLYRPARGSGEWSKKYERQRSNEGIFGISHSQSNKPGADEGIFGISHSDRYPDRY